MVFDLAEIEDKIIAHLQLTFCNQIKSIAIYHGEISALIRKIAQMSIQLPAVFLLYRGSTFTENGNNTFGEEINFSLIILSKSLRDRMDNRTSIYGIIEFIKSTIMGANLGLKLIAPFKPERITALAITKEFSIYGFDFKTFVP
jgi:phage gp37-like protein